MRNQIVILAAGKGTRMGNNNIPKVLIMLKNKPLILYLLEEIEKINQLAKPVIVVGFGAEKVKAVLGSSYSYAHQSEQLGTAHALESARRNIKAENILVLYGDMPFIKADSLKALVSLHFRRGSNISMLTAEVKNFKGMYKSLEHYGRILRDTQHQIAGIVEYKDASSGQKKIKEINAGIYMFKTQWLWENVKRIENKNAQGEYYLTDIVEIAIAQGQKVPSLLVDAKEVLSVNSREDLQIAEKLLG